MKPDLTYRIFPLGDSALTIDFGNIISENINKKVISLSKSLQKKPLRGMVEVIPAYTSLSIIYDTVLIRKNFSKNKIAFEWVKEEIKIFLQTHVELAEEASRLVKIPVCYDEEYGIDIAHVAKEKQISKEEIIRLHTEKQYRVYMLGFLPGFPYLGEINEKLVMPRKPQPLMVAQGSVAIAGKQTGIYSLSSPGGWNVIGRTPLQLFDGSKAEPALFKAGDKVEFYSIQKEEFSKMRS